MIHKTVKNPWGQSLEGQRSDLWMVDLAPVLDMVREPGGVVTTTDYAAIVDALPEREVLRYFASTVTFPEKKIAVDTIIRGTRKEGWPGYNEEIADTRIDFIVGGPVGSKLGLARLLYAWRLLSLAGQNLGTSRYVILRDARSKPEFKVDLTVNFLRGTSAADQALARSSASRLSNCWPAQIQPGDLDMDSKEVHQMSVFLRCDDMVPINPDASGDLAIDSNFAQRLALAASVLS